MQAVFEFPQKYHIKELKQLGKIKRKGGTHNGGIGKFFNNITQL